MDSTFDEGKKPLHVGRKAFSHLLIHKMPRLVEELHGAPHIKLFAEPRPSPKKPENRKPGCLGKNGTKTTRRGSYEAHRPISESFNRYDFSALFTTVSDNSAILLHDFFKIIYFRTLYFITFRAIVLIQFFGLDGQVAVPTLKSVSPVRQ